MQLFFVPSYFQFWSCRQVNFSGRCFLDSNSCALKIQSVASFKFSAFVSRMKRS
ncbi:hypothetical protein FORC37_p030 (plasmid) [Vibrio vulnificus]|nr:hypothetical protein FORC37_p030 [Vibrio vulnificus]